jgi:chromosome segregation ATPase
MPKSKKQPKITNFVVESANGEKHMADKGDDHGGDAGATSGSTTSTSTRASRSGSRAKVNNDSTSESTTEQGSAVGNVNLLQQETLNKILEKLESLDDQVGKLTEELRTKTVELEKSVNFVHDEVADLKQENKRFYADQKTLQRKLQTQAYDIETIKSENKKLNRKMLEAEMHSRKRNVIFDGIPEGNGHGQEQLLKALSKADIQCDKTQIARCHRLSYEPRGYTGKLS